MSAIFRKSFFLFIASQIVLNLVGCVSLSNPQTKINERCATSKVLITDLSKPGLHQKVMLEDGSICTL